MHAAVQAVIDQILLDEGGIGDAGDGKGVTRFGQTPSWLEENGFIPPNNAGDAAVNYERWFERTALSAVIVRSPIVGHLVADFAVHSGLRPAVLALQRALDVKTDGVLGPRTLAALQQLPAPPVARRVLAARMRYVGILLKAAVPDRRKDASGWLNRLARQVEKLP